MLSELPYQSPQLLILPMPEREGSACTHAEESSRSRWRKGQKDHRLRAGSHEGGTYYVPNTTDTATGSDRAAPSCGNHGLEGANQRLPQGVKPPCGWLRASRQEHGDCLFRETKGQAQRKAGAARMQEASERGMQGDLGGHSRRQTTHKTNSGLCITQSH